VPEGEKVRSPRRAIGLAAVVAALLACVAVLAVRRESGDLRVRDELQALDQQKAQLAEETRAMREETRRLHEERVESRKERMRALAERYRKGDERQYDRILLRSACPYEIAVALHYRDLDDAWVTRGWWSVPPGGSVTTDAMTRDRTLFLYGENQAVGRTWDGAGAAGSLFLTISDSRFDLVEGDPVVYDGPRSVSFLRRLRAEGRGDYTELFECPAEAVPPTGSPPPSPSKGVEQGRAAGR
jgi:hypothetical protein